MSLRSAPVSKAVSKANATRRAKVTAAKSAGSIHLAAVIADSSDR